MGFQVETACHELELGQNMSCSGLEVRSECGSVGADFGGKKSASHPGMNVGSRYCVLKRSPKQLVESWMSSS